MIGTVRTVNFGYAFIGCSAGLIFCHASEMPPDEVGRRYLLPGEKVSFELGQYNGRKRAVNVSLCVPREPVDLDTYYEEGEVKHVRSRGEYAFVLRPFGGAVMLHWHNVQSAQSYDNGHVKFFPGQQWRYAIAPPLDGDPDNAWLAVNAVECA